MCIKTVLILIAFLAGINLSAAIKCYVCAGSENSDCAKGKIATMAVANCKAPGIGYSNHGMYMYFNHPASFNESLSDDTKIQAVCLKFYVTDYVPKLFSRGCGLFPASIDPCEYLEQNTHITKCKSCKTDLCNQKVEFNQDDFINYIED